MVAVEVAVVAVELEGEICIKFEIVTVITNLEMMAAVALHTQEDTLHDNRPEHQA